MDFPVAPCNPHPHGRSSCHATSLGMGHRLRLCICTYMFLSRSFVAHFAIKHYYHNHPDHSLTISTDSHSLLKAMEYRPPVTHHLGSLLSVRPGPINLLRLSSHGGISGNELADKTPPATLRNPSPTRSRDTSATKHSQIHHKLIDGQRRFVAGFPGLKIAMPQAIVRMRSSLHAFELVTLLCCKSAPISPTPPQTHYVPFAKRSRRQSSTSCGDGPGSMQRDTTSLEVPSAPQGPYRRCWRS